MTEYNVAMICEKGHVVSTNVEGKITQHFCKICGAPNITACQFCKKSIQGSAKERYGYIPKYRRPSYCHSCSKPYPWTVRVLSEIDKLNSEYTKESGFLKDVLNNMVVETPSTSLSVIRFQKFLETCNPFVADVLKQFLSTFGCSLVLQLLGLS